MELVSALVSFMMSTLIVIVNLFCIFLLCYGTWFGLTVKVGSRISFELYPLRRFFDKDDEG